MTNQKPIRRIIGVQIVNSGDLSEKDANDRFKFIQIIKAAFMIDFNAARIMVNDMFTKKFKEPYSIKGFTFDGNVFSNMADKYNIEYGYIYADLKESPRKVLESLMLTTAEIELIVEQNEQLKQENHELTKEIRSLKSTLYKTAVDLNKHYQSISNLMNCAGPRAAHIIKDLAAEIAEDEQ